MECALGVCLLRTSGSDVGWSGSAGQPGRVELASCCLVSVCECVCVCVCVCNMTYIIYYTQLLYNYTGIPSL